MKGVDPVAFKVPKRSILEAIVFWIVVSCLAPPGWAADPLRLDVRITGIEGELLENVNAFLGIASAAENQKTGLIQRITNGGEQEKDQLPESAIRQLHRQATEEIRQALQPFGYYAPDVSARLRLGDEGWQATYDIDPGPRTTLRQVDIQVTGDGAADPLVTEALASIDLAPGQALDHRRYETAKDTLFDALYAAGYIDATSTRAEIRVFAAMRKADIFLIIASGPAFRFGPITIEQDILHPNFVDRFVAIQPGDRFDTRRLIDLQLALRDSDYFSQVEVLAERENAVGTQIPVIVKTEPSKPRRYLFGVGFGTDTGPRLTAGAEWRRINRRGHKMRTDFRVSSIEQSISTQYTIPIKNVTRDSLAFTAAASRQNVGDVDIDQYKVGTSLNERWRGLRRRLYLSLERESFDLGNGTQSSDLLMPGIQLSRRYADDLLNVRKGYSVSLDVHGGIESPLTETTFMHTRIDGRLVIPLTAQSRLLLRGEYGAIEAAAFSDLPPSQRFYAGGDQSVRGYGYQELGPQNSDGDVIGGQYLAVASMEIDALIYGNFGVAAFYDAGNASDDRLPDLKRAYGAGLRYRSPIGMIRLDVARPLDDPDTDFRLHISIGPDI